MPEITWNWRLTAPLLFHDPVPVYVSLPVSVPISAYVRFSCFFLVIMCLSIPYSCLYPSLSLFQYVCLCFCLCLSVSLSMYLFLCLYIRLFLPLQVPTFGLASGRNQSLSLPLSVCVSLTPIVCLCTVLFSVSECPSQRGHPGVETKVSGTRQTTEDYSVSHGP